MVARGGVKLTVRVVTGNVTLGLLIVNVCEGDSVAVLVVRLTVNKDE